MTGPRLTYYGYAVIDTRTTPPVLRDLKLTRKDAREYVQWSKDGDHLRIRRAQVTLYHS